MANARGQIYAKAIRISNDIKTDTMIVCSRTDAMAVLQTVKKKLQKKIYKKKTVMGNM